MKHNQELALLVLLLTLCSLIAAQSCQAQIPFQVILDTSALPQDSFLIEFTLSDGSVVDYGAADTNNSLQVNSIDLDGGIAGNELPAIGNVTGNLTNEPITLTDGDPAGVADFAQLFTPGSRLRLDFLTTTNFDAGPTPDHFLLKMLDANLTALPTTDPSGDNALLSADIIGNSMTVSSIQTFGSAPGSPFTLPAAQIQTTPEPTVGWFLGSGLGVWFILRRRSLRLS